MKTDRELLELAAKSMGFKDFSFADMRGWGEARYGLSEGICTDALDDYWNPLVDGNAALNLAVVHGIEVSFHHHLGQALAVVPGYSRGRGEYWHSGAPMEATRRAIVHAAAAIQLAKEAP
ncbi:hypothetical protein HNP33_003082 [Comamonas odontotermitis]|uniref:Phage ABA sandwich domain-containing protein n=1 Tax=Comamonas odontotermitis TaxID=379895 RepID=A0ABR6RIJ8_9BURK|nr:hypothetical protein [Comamonas odontotermitis]MBB6578977.1 hypothetical protein [Comamonas odontotermitis]